MSRRKTKFISSSLSGSALSIEINMWVKEKGAELISVSYSAVAVMRKSNTIIEYGALVVYEEEDIGYADEDAKAIYEAGKELFVENMIDVVGK